MKILAFITFREVSDLGHRLSLTTPNTNVARRSVIVKF